MPQQTAADRRLRERLDYAADVLARILRLPAESVAIDNRGIYLTVDQAEALIFQLDNGNTPDPIDDDD